MALLQLYTSIYLKCYRPGLSSTVDEKLVDQFEWEYDLIWTIDFEITHDEGKKRNNW